MTDHIELYRSGLRRKKWRWRYVAENGNILADSGQGYVRRIDAVRAAARVTGSYLDSDGQSRAVYRGPLRVVEAGR